MNDSSPTHRQKQILSFLSKHIDQSGFPPTRQEICDHFGFRSPNAAESHLRALERKGMVTIEGGRSRGLHLTAAARALLPPPRGAADRLPLVGQVAAGSPILAEENIEEYCSLDPTLFRLRPHYFLRVRGDSMKDLGILDHDLLAVHRTPVADNGQVVVARLGDEVTVKRFQRRGRRVRLLPANPDYAPIEIDLAEQPLVIEGLGVGVLRDRMPD